jgi:hypothetical protein
VRSILAAIVILGAAPSIVLAQSPVDSGECPVVTESRLTASWDPRTLAGEYRVRWVSDTAATPKTQAFRLFLWPTSMRDASSATHRGPAPRDTVAHAAYGLMVPDSGNFTKQRIEEMRAGIDPVYPPVLLLARISNDQTPPVRYWTVLLIETVGNRRDGIDVLDGAGIGMWIRDANESGFTGTFQPWGLVIDDRGHYCAQRVSRP